MFKVEVTELKHRMKIIVKTFVDIHSREKNKKRLVSRNEFSKGSKKEQKTSKILFMMTSDMMSKNFSSNILYVMEPSLGDVKRALKKKEKFNFKTGPPNISFLFKLNEMPSRRKHLRPFLY